MEKTMRDELKKLVDKWHEFAEFAGFAEFAWGKNHNISSFELTERLNALRAQPAPEKCTVCYPIYCALDRGHDGPCKPVIDPRLQ
jgi:hypothetical protein